MSLTILRRRIVEPKEPLVLRHCMQGIFIMEVRRPDGRVRKRLRFNNLITDAGLNVIGTSARWLAVCKVGTGSNTPAVTDTALQTLVGSTTRTSGTDSNGIAPNYYGATANRYRFTTGVAAGNLTEVGIFTDAGSPTCFSRALILDGGGSPTTLTVLSDETLDVLYEIRIYAPLVDIPGTITISGADYVSLQRAADATGVQWSPGGGTGIGTQAGVNQSIAYSGGIGAITTTPSGTNSSADSISNAAYSNNSLQRDSTMTWGLTAANFVTGSPTGVRAFLARYGINGGGLGSVQIEISPAIPKDSTKILAMTFRHAWSRGSVPP